MIGVVTHIQKQRMSIVPKTATLGKIWAPAVSTASMTWAHLIMQLSSK